LQQQVAKVVVKDSDEIARRQGLAVIAPGFGHPMLSGRETRELWFAVVIGVLLVTLKTGENSSSAFSGVGGRWYQSDGRHHDDCH
jgi:hypothetical protein